VLPGAHPQMTAPSVGIGKDPIQGFTGSIMLVPLLRWIALKTCCLTFVMVSVDIQVISRVTFTFIGDARIAVLP